jgi:predicted transposase/invertase (TIGR01784 family)
MSEYQNSLKIYRDWYSSLTTAKTEGIVEGEAKEKIKIARKMIEDGMSVDVISKYTGLAVEQIRQLNNGRE